MSFPDGSSTTCGSQYSTVVLAGVFFTEPISAQGRPPSRLRAAAIAEPSPLGGCVQRVPRYKRSPLRRRIGPCGAETGARIGSLQELPSSLSRSQDPSEFATASSVQRDSVVCQDAIPSSPPTCSR